MFDETTEKEITTRRRIVIDRDRCQGHARCISVAPDLFDLDDDGFAMPLRAEVDGADLAVLERAVSWCPEHAIAAPLIDNGG